MKRILISIIVLCCLLFCGFTHSLICTLNYCEQGDNVSLTDVLTGYDVTSISLKEDKLIYYNMLDKDIYSSLNFFEAMNVIFRSDDALSLTFASSKTIDTNKYDSIFFLCDIIILDNEAYLYVSYITDDGICNTIYKADNNTIVSEADLNGFEVSTIKNDLVSDTISTIKLFSFNYVFIIITAVVIIFLIPIVYKISRRFKTNQENKGENQ